MLRLSSCPRYKFWIALCVVLIFVFGIIRDTFPVVLRNYLLLQYLRTLQVDEGLAEIAEQISQVTDSMPSDNDLNRVAGMSFFVAGDNERALDYLLRAQAAKVDDCVTLHWLGRAYEQAGDYANALLTMYQAGDAEYFPVLPVDMSDEELENLAQDLIGSPLSAHARFELAEGVYSIDASLARQYFELAFRRAPEDLHYSLGAAWFYYAQQDFEVAKIFGEYARSQFPTEPWVYFYWGALNYVTGNLDQAIQDLEKAIELSPTGNVGNKAHIELSKIYNLREEYDAAIEHLEAANRIQEGQLSVYLLRSQAYAGLQECGTAQEQLERASSLIRTERQETIYSHFMGIIQRDCP